MMRLSEVDEVRVGIEGDERWEARIPAPEPATNPRNRLTAQKAL